MGEKKHLKILEISMIAFGVMMAVLSFALSRKDLGIGILVGGIIAILNFQAWKWFGQKLIQTHTKRPEVLIGLMTAKSIFPFVMIAMVLWIFKIHVVGLSVGLSSLIVAVFFYTFWLTLKTLWQGDRNENGS